MLDKPIFSRVRSRLKRPWLRRHKLIELCLYGVRILNLGYGGVVPWERRQYPVQDLP